MNLKLKILLILPLFLLSSCNGVSTHDEFLKKGISFIQSGLEVDNCYVNIVGTYETLDSSINGKIDFDMSLDGGHSFFDISPTFNPNPPTQDYETLVEQYLHNNRILNYYIVYTANEDMKTYYIYNEQIKVEDYSSSKNKLYTDSYTWNNEGMLIEMCHYFLDETTSLPYAKTNVTISKVNRKN